MSSKSSTVLANEKAVVGGALVGGLLLFGFLTNTCKSPMDNDKSGRNVSSAADYAHDVSSELSTLKEINVKVAQLESEITSLKDNSVDETIISGLKAQLSKQRSLTAESKERIISYKIETDELKTKLQSLSVSNTHSVLVDNTEVDELNETISQLGASLEFSESKNKELVTQLSNAEGEFEKQSKASLVELTKVQKSFQLLNQDNKQLAEELSKTQLTLKQMTLDANDEGALITRVAELANLNSQQREIIRKKNQQIVQLNDHINKNKAEKGVFVKHAEDLPTVAQGLFKDLKSLEGQSPDKIQATYIKYLKKHGATAKHRVKFRSGSSVVSETDKKAIAKLTAEADEHAYFFIVGYADKSGTAASNQSLSSKRSINVAKSLVIKTKTNQSAQAVYLGQTDRFGSPSDNRVVEIWEIK